MFDLLLTGNTSPTLDLQWEKGDVGNWLLRVGKARKVAHVYLNPWSPLWVADVRACDYSESFVTVEEAKLVAELMFRAWLDEVLHYDHGGDIINFGGDGIDFGC